MLLQLGKLYRVDLRLVNATAFGPSWLIGAFTISRPGADVVDVQLLPQDRAQVLLRWREVVPGKLAPGDTISVMAQGIVIPGSFSPHAVVEKVTPAGQTLLNLEQVLQPHTKIAISAALLAASWWLSKRVKDGNATNTRAS